jgi:hypothetical protein
MLRTFDYFNALLKMRNILQHKFELSARLSIFLPPIRLATLDYQRGDVYMKRSINRLWLFVGALALLISHTAAYAQVDCATIDCLAPSERPLITLENVLQLQPRDASFGAARLATAAFSNLLVADDLGSLRFYNAAEPTTALGTVNATVSAFDVSADGALAAFVARDFTSGAQTLNLIAAAPTAGSGTPIATYPLPMPEPVVRIALDARFIITGHGVDGDPAQGLPALGYAVVWDAATGAQITRLETIAPVTAIAFDYTGLYAATSTTEANGRTLVWSTESWQPIAILDAIGVIAFNPSLAAPLNDLVVGGQEGGVFIFTPTLDVNAAPEQIRAAGYTLVQRVAAFEPLDQIAQPVQSLAINPAGDLIAVGNGLASANAPLPAAFLDSIALIQPASGSVVQRLSRGYNTFVYDLAFSADGTTLLSVYDFFNGQPLTLWSAG